MTPQKGFSDILLIVVILVLVGGGAYYYFNSSKLANIQVQTPPVATPSIVIEEDPEFKDLPLYPGTTDISRAIHQPGETVGPDPWMCNPGNTTPACVYGTISYTYKTEDSWKKVSDWYTNNSGWQITGGAGAEGSSTATYTKGSDKIQVNISEYPDNGVTQVVLDVPIKR